MTEEIWAPIYTGTTHHYAVSNRGRVKNLMTGTIRRLPPNDVLPIGRKLCNIKRLVVKAFIEPNLDNSMIVRQVDPEGGIGVDNLYIQTRREFMDEIRGPAMEALQKYWAEHRKRADGRRRPGDRGYLYPRNHRYRAAVIAKHEAKMRGRAKDD